MTATAKKKRTKTSYRLRDGFRLPVSGEVVGVTVEQLKRSQGGSVAPAELVFASEDEDAPLHPCFEWCDSTAAHLHREEQARYVLRSYQVVVESGEDEFLRIANVCVTTGEGERRYVSSAKAMSDEELREQVVREAESMLRGVAARYRDIPGLKALFQAAIDRLDLA